MALLGSIGYSEPSPILRCERLVLRMPTMADHAAWATLRESSYGFLKPWEPTWPVDDLTRAAFRRRLRRYQREVRNDSGYPFFVFLRGSGEIVGGLTLSNVRRGVTQSCALGYWVGQPHARQGYMSEAVACVLGFVFQRLGLQRVEAACLPHNNASIALLRRTGFTQEGYARAYLRIDAQWRDHFLFAHLAEDPESPACPQVASDTYGESEKHRL
ncbi:GNAT family protein [Breoghania sp.]|uniref:GNAT family N-acetyltransferase n=1 Tax=Breoghania sp. TaxID=2065378 RepID=UPI0026093A7A|nr:GNAT family protein [Breoghania sp.]MDJ0930277.1 GNAT family protein [Breoghania sp.]